MGDKTSMIDNDENIFNYDLDFIECEVLNMAYIDEASYILFTSPIKRLSDLHLLFLIRRDKENCDRIMNKLRNYVESDVNAELKG